MKILHTPSYFLSMARNGVCSSRLHRVALSTLETKSRDAIRGWREREERREVKSASPITRSRPTGVLRRVKVAHVSRGSEMPDFRRELKASLCSLVYTWWYAIRDTVQSNGEMVSSLSRGDDACVWYRFLDTQFDYLAVFMRAPGRGTVRETKEKEKLQAETVGAAEERWQHGATVPLFANVSRVTARTRKVRFLDDFFESSACVTATK